MVDLVRINDDVISSDDLVLQLKFNNDLDDLLDQMIKDRLLMLGAEKANIKVTDAEVQERADQLRRVLGLVRAAEAHAFLDRMQASVDDFAEFVRGLVVKGKMTDWITSDDKVEEYFKLNKPKFDTVTLGHIVVADEGVAKEIVATLEENPKQFPDLAMEHSLAETSLDGGMLGTVRRGQIDPKVESKIFNAERKVPIGPLGENGGPYDIFMVLNKSDAKMDKFTQQEVRTALLDDWFTAAVKEVSIS